MNLCTSVFVYVGSIGLYKRIVNAYTQSIRIANADGQEFETLACVFAQTPSPVRILHLIQVNLWTHLLAFTSLLISFK